MIKNRFPKAKIDFPNIKEAFPMIEEALPTAKVRFPKAKKVFLMMKMLFPMIKKRLPTNEEELPFDYMSCFNRKSVVNRPFLGLMTKKERFLEVFLQGPKRGGKNGRFWDARIKL